MTGLSNRPMVDAHFHVFDPRFPLPGNGGYMPSDFTVRDYRAATAGSACKAVWSPPPPRMASTRPLWWRRWLNWDQASWP
jgi:hypothetical protein